MKWWQAEVRTSEEASDSVAECLLELGAAGVATQDPSDLRLAYENVNDTTFFDPLFLKDLAEYVRIRAYFPSHDGQVRYGFRLPDDEKLSTLDVIRLYDERSYESVSPEDFNAILTKEIERIGQFLDVSPAAVSGSFIDEEDWANEWRQHYQTVKISERLVIRPSWEEYKPLEHEKVIVLDPGSAFGTGTHESTQLSLMGLDHYMVDGAKVLDLGTGSGVLAIAAALLGARQVDAVDIDPHAVDVARDNVQINQLDHIVNCFTGELKDTARYDVIAANLLADLHIKLAGQIREHLNDLGLYVACGIIADRKDDVIKAFKAVGLGLHGQEEMNDWYMLAFHIASDNDADEYATLDALD